MRVLSTVAAAVALAVVATGTASAQSKEPLRLPFAYTFSGPYIEYGERAWNLGLVPAVEEINKAGGVKGRPLEFYKIDTRFPDTAQWISEFRRLCNDPNVPLIYGVGATKSTLAIYEDTNKCGITVFNPSSAGNWPHKDFGEWTFRYQPIASKVYPSMIAKVHKVLGISRFAISHTQDDEYAVNNNLVLRKVLAEQGLEIVSETSFRGKETNFASQVAAIRAAKPEAVVLTHQAGDAGTFLLQLRDRGVDAQAVSDTVTSNVDFWKLSKGHAKGAIGYALYAADDPRPIVQNWVKLWREKSGKMDAAPDNIVTAYYDATHIVAHVLNTATDLSRKSIRDAFLRVKDYEAISGTVTWSAVGDVDRPSAVLIQIGEGGVTHNWPRTGS
jgi:branched-chain amino acid transport system substrate-binding protein